MEGCSGAVIQVYQKLFPYLEQDGLLDHLNEWHLLALHYIYIPRINNALKSFIEGWNDHCIRSYNNQSPLQIQKDWYCWMGCQLLTITIL